MPMEKFLFLDLDDTVFQTRRKCIDISQATPAAYTLSGDPSSYSLPKQKAILALLNEQWRIIPTTARTQAAYSRVNLGFPLYDGVILNHGGTILSSEGKEDEQWRTYINSQLETLYIFFPPLKEAIEEYAKQHNIALLVRVISESGSNYYLEVRHNHAIFSELQSILFNCVQVLLQEFTAFEAHLNSNSLTLLPRCVNKSHAVNYRLEALKKEYGEILTMGMGDSLSDAPFIAQCDYAMIPQNTQLHKNLIKNQ